MKHIPILTLLIISAFGYDENSCAYFSTHVVATPLHKCSAYSYADTKYSWNFECDESGNVNCNYFGADTECSTGYAGSTGVDAVAGTVQCVGSGENCNTVDIVVKGFTDAVSGTCDNTGDYYSFSFVVDECIPSTLGDAVSSAVLSCDADRLYFEYYTGCKDCSCDMETYTYEYYADLDGCWDIICGVNEELGVGTVNGEQEQLPPEEPPACVYKGRNNKRSGDKLKELLMKPMEVHKAKYYTSKKAQFAANVMDGKEIGKMERKTGMVFDKMMMNWIYVVAVGCSVILIAGAWRFIKQKEYSMV